METARLAVRPRAAGLQGSVNATLGEDEAATSKIMAAISGRDRDDFSRDRDDFGRRRDDGTTEIVESASFQSIKEAQRHHSAERAE